MNDSPVKLPVGTQLLLAQADLQGLIDQLHQRGYRVIGPQVADSAVVLDELFSVDQLPLGWLDQQDGGLYRLQRDEEAGYFDHVVGPHSLKPYLFPPSETVEQVTRGDRGWQVESISREVTPVAVIGARSCDLHALAIQDRVFLEGPYVDPGYHARRAALFLVAVQCRRAAATCFCHSMNTGPRADSGFDLALTELPGYFVVQVGSALGGEIMADVPNWSLATVSHIEQAQQQSLQLQQALHRRAAEQPAADAPRPRHLDTHQIHDLLLGNLEHANWQRVAERCLSCANCTMVCPTCFCSSVQEVADLSGETVERQRQWSSCFNAEHAYLSSGVVHHSTASRYRQWLTHKLATWHDQFGTSGCVGCGRCITWCPVGIDLTEEVAALREET